MQKTCLAHFKETVHVLTTKGKNSKKKAINKSSGGEDIFSIFDFSVERQSFFLLFSFADLEPIKLLT